MLLLCPWECVGWSRSESWLGSAGVWVHCEKPRDKAERNTGKELWEFRETRREAEEALCLNLSEERCLSLAVYKPRQRCKSEPELPSRPRCPGFTRREELRILCHGKPLGLHLSPISTSQPLPFAVSLSFPACILSSVPRDLRSLVDIS